MSKPHEQTLSVKVDVAERPTPIIGPAVVDVAELDCTTRFFEGKSDLIYAIAQF